MLAIASLVALVAVGKGTNQCNTGTLQCCEQVEQHLTRSSSSLRSASLTAMQESLASLALTVALLAFLALAVVLSATPNQFAALATK